MKGGENHLQSILRHLLFFVCAYTLFLTVIFINKGELMEGEKKSFFADQNRALKEYFLVVLAPGEEMCVANGDILLYAVYAGITATLAIALELLISFYYFSHLI